MLGPSIRVKVIKLKKNEKLSVFEQVSPHLFYFMYPLNECYVLLEFVYDIDGSVLVFVN